MHCNADCRHVYTGKVNECVCIRVHPERALPANFSTTSAILHCFHSNVAFLENGSYVCICFVDSHAEWGVAWVYSRIGRECANIFDTYAGFSSFPENNVSYGLRISRFRAERVRIA